MKKYLRWMRLDNAALIYPAAKRKNWTNVYRISFSLKENIDHDMLDIAIKHVVPRFPSICVRIKPGFFWYYLEEVPHAPESLNEEDCNINKITWKELNKCAFRVLYYKNRISVELFHSVTDGTGGLIFAKNICAEYIRLKYRVAVPCTDGVVDLNEKPSADELEDSFHKYASDYWSDPADPDAYMLDGHLTDGVLHLTTGILSVDELKAKAKEYSSTVTVFLAAVLMKSFYEIQNLTVPFKKRKNIGILIPVNLRKHFESRSMRNFTSYVIPSFDPRLGEYTLEEMICVIKNTMGLRNNPKCLAGKFSYNVKSEKITVLRLAPLFLKNIAMKTVYNKVGEKKCCICLSNLGNVVLPDVMNDYVERVEFVLGAQADCHINCSVCGYGGKLYINFVRNIEESEIERIFFTTLRKMGIHILIESNTNRE